MRSWTGNWVFIIIHALLYRLKISSLCTNLMMWDEVQQKREMSAFKGTHFVTQRKTPKRITRTTLCTPLPPRERGKKKQNKKTPHQHSQNTRWKKHTFATFHSSVLDTSRCNANQSNRSSLKGCATNDKYITTCWKTQTIFKLQHFCEHVLFAQKKGKKKLLLKPCKPWSKAYCPTTVT